MAEKGLVTRDESERTHVYTAALTRDETQRQLVSDLVRSRVWRVGGRARAAGAQRASGVAGGDGGDSELDRRLQERDTRMSIVASLMTGHAAQALAWALMHFLWQGAVLAAWPSCSCAGCGLPPRCATPSAWRRSRRCSSRPWRPSPSLPDAAAAPSTTAVTFRDLQSAVSRSVQSGCGGGSACPDRVRRRQHGRARPIPGLPMFVICRCGSCGVARSRHGRWAAGWSRAGWPSRRATVTPEIDALARRIAEIGSRSTRSCAIVESSAVAVPVMMGWLKPVIVLPAAALAGLTPMQVEALIAHELAHVRRHDYLVNLSRSSSRRCCSITRPSGGCRARCARSANTAATIWRSACAIGSSTSAR